MMKIAKWNPETQTPYDIRDRNSVTASNGVPYRDMASLNRIGYYEYQPVQLAGGEVLADVTHSKPDNVIIQNGTVIDAETVAAEKAQTEDQAFMDAVHEHGLSVIALVSVLGVFGLSFPVEASEVDKDIKRKLATGQLTPDQLPFVSVLSIAYSELRGLGDDRIVQIAEYLQDNPQVAQALMEGGEEQEDQDHE